MGWERDKERVIGKRRERVIKVCPKEYVRSDLLEGRGQTAVIFV
jgi:hypothetical protein